MIKMSRFGLIAKRCERPNTFELDCLKKLYIGNQSCAIYCKKLSATELYIWNLENDRWYQLEYRLPRED